MERDDMAPMSAEQAAAWRATLAEFPPDHPYRVTVSKESVTLQVMRLVAYLRVSTAGQVDAYGLDAQRSAIRRWAKVSGHRITAWCTDGAVSGTVDGVDRPGLSEAISYLRKPAQADGVIVARLDRLARALTVQEAALALIWRLGGKAFTAEGGEVHQDDPDDPMRTAMRQMVGVFAELDRRSVIKRLRDGRGVKAASGRHAVGEYRYGTRGEGTGRERDAVTHPEETAAVARIVDLRQSGASYRQIAATLDTEGHKPRRAARWSAMTVRRIWEREASEMGSAPGSAR